MLFPLPGISPFLFSIFPFNFVQTLSPLFLRVVCGCSRFPCQRKWWEDNIREWTGLDFAKSRRAMKNRKKKWRKLVAKSCVVPQRPSWLRDRWDERREQFGSAQNRNRLQNIYNWWKILIGEIVYRVCMITVNLAFAFDRMNCVLTL